MTLLSKERLIKYVTDLHDREISAYCGASKAGGPAFSPNVLVEILGKVEAGDFDQDRGMEGENKGLVRSFIEGVMYMPRHLFRDLTVRDFARSLGITAFILLAALLIGKAVGFIVLMVW